MFEKSFFRKRINSISAHEELHSINVFYSVPVLLFVQVFMQLRPHHQFYFPGNDYLGAKP
ncbi:hypothetical protein M076_2221 [Bacteroides fragilis str. 2-F-2 |uniref:Uncharacterized protein n=1 Tax=Bacteroides fragilis str. 2-F-2 \|nr:hypothetical protein M076_2221 [Bacteroides fragilis str. 2-F-2 \